MFDEERFTITYERLDVIVVNSIFPECYLCRAYFLIGEVAVAIKVPGNLTLRFHSGICWDYFLTALNLFEEKKGEFTPQIPYLS